MAVIIALQGIHDTGKTETLKALGISIAQKYNLGTTIINKFNVPGDVVEILAPVNNMTVGIASAGDFRNPLLKNITFLLNSKCDIIFCACRSYGNTVAAVNSFAPPNIVAFVPKQIESNPSNQTAVNTRQANDLMFLAGI